MELEVKVLNFGLIQCLRPTRTIRRIQGVRMCGNVDQMCVLIKECMNIVFISRTNHISSVQRMIRGSDILLFHRTPTLSSIWVF